MFDMITGDLLSWLGEHRQWLGWCIFLIALLESLAIAGLLVPGVVLLVATTAMAGAWGMPLISVMGWAFAGAVVGDMLSFSLGRLFHQDIRRLGLFRRNPHWIGRGESFFRRYGMLSILLGRFVGPIRPIIPMIAGMLDMATWRFVLVNLVSALAWAPVYVIPGYAAGHAAAWTVPEFFWEQAFGLLAAIISVLGLVFYCLWKQERWSALAAAATCLAGLVGLSFARPWLGVLQSSQTEWAYQVANQADTLLALWAPLGSSAFAVLLGLLILPGLLIGAGKRQALMLSLAVLFNLLAGFALQLESAYLASSTSLTLLASLLLMCSRSFSFWVRVLWLSMVLPAAALITAGLLASNPVALTSLLSSWLNAGMACLFSLWLLERAGPLTPITPRWLAIFMTLPVVAALLSWSGLHQL